MTLVMIWRESDVERLWVAWLNCHRRVAKDLEAAIESALAWLTIAEGKLTHIGAYNFCGDPKAPYSGEISLNQPRFHGV